MMQFAFEDATAAMHQDVRRRVMACMETGQIDQARSIVTEYHDVHPAEAKALGADLVAAYGTAL